MTKMGTWPASSSEHQAAGRWLRERWHDFDFRPHSGDLFNTVAKLLAQHLLGWGLKPDEAKPLVSAIALGAEETGRWPEGKSTRKFVRDVVGRVNALWQDDPAFGCYTGLSSPILLHTGELQYLSGIPRDGDGLDTRRRFVYYGMYAQELARQMGRSHFVFPSRMVIYYMYMEASTSLTREQKLNRFRYLVKAYNPRARDYCGVPLLTDLWRGYKMKSANRYRVGDDYDLRTGVPIPATDVEQQLELPSIAPVFEQKLAIPREPVVKGAPRDWNDPLEETIIAHGDLTALPPEGAEIQIDEGTWVGHSSVDMRVHISPRCTRCGRLKGTAACVGASGACTHGAKGAPAHVCEGWGDRCCICGAEFGNSETD